MAATKAAAKPQAKTTKKTKKPAKKVTAPVKSEEYFYEVNGEQVQVNQLDLKQKIHEAYKNDGHRPNNIRSLQVYVNLEERKAYYVINGKAEGKFVEI